MLSNLVIITILNWEKYNPRSDRENYTWFRFLNNFFTDPKIYILTSMQKLVLVFLFCEASKQGKPEFLTSASQACDQVGCDVDLFFKSLELLEQLDVIKTSLRRGKKSSRIKSASSRRVQDITDTTDITDITNTTEPAVVDPLKINSPEELVSLWHAHCPDLVKVDKLTDHRKKKIKDRALKEPTKAYWEMLFKKISSTPFLMGKTKSGKWKASFDWILKSEDNAVKVLEGTYDRSEGDGWGKTSGNLNELDKALKIIEEATT